MAIVYVGGHDLEAQIQNTDNRDGKRAKALKQAGQVMPLSQPPAKTREAAIAKPAPSCLSRATALLNINGIMLDNCKVGSQLSSPPIVFLLHDDPHYWSCLSFSYADNLFIRFSSF